MVHQYKLNGYNIVLDTASGSVHAVDEVAYDIIEMYKSSSPEEIIEAITKKYADVSDAEVLECIDDIRLIVADQNVVHFRSSPCAIIISDSSLRRKRAKP